MSRLGFQIWMSWKRIGYTVYLISFPDLWECDYNTVNLLSLHNKLKICIWDGIWYCKKRGEGIIIQCHHSLCDKSFTRQTSVLLPEQLTTLRRSLTQICDFWILLQPDQAAKHFPKNRFCHWMIDQTTNITRLRQQHSLANCWEKNEIAWRQKTPFFAQKEKCTRIRNRFTIILRNESLEHQPISCAHQHLTGDPFQLFCWKWSKLRNRVKLNDRACTIYSTL